MKPPEGKNHDRMVGLTVFDTLALGKENQAKLDNLLSRLDDIIKLNIKLIEEEDIQITFVSHFHDLIHLIQENQLVAPKELQNEITFYFESLRAYDYARQKPEMQSGSRELEDLVAITWPIP